MKKRIVAIGQWGQKHWLQLIIIMSILMMVFLYGVKMFKMSYLLGLSSFPVAILCFGE